MIGKALLGALEQGPALFAEGLLGGIISELVELGLSEEEAEELAEQLAAQFAGGRGFY